MWTTLNVTGKGADICQWKFWVVLVVLVVPNVTVAKVSTRTQFGWAVIQYIKEVCSASPKLLINLGLNSADGKTL